MIPGIPSPPPAGTSRNDSSDQAAGKTLPVDTPISGKVVSVSQPAGGNSYRLTVEVNNQLLQLTASQPLAKGSLIELLQQQDGRLQIQQPASPPLPAGTEQANRQASLLAQQARDSVTLQLSRLQPGQQPAESPALRQPSNGVVISSQPQPATAQANNNGAAAAQTGTSATTTTTATASQSGMSGPPSTTAGPQNQPPATTAGTTNSGASGQTVANTLSTPTGNGSETAPATRTAATTAPPPGSAPPAPSTPINATSTATQADGAKPAPQPTTTLAPRPSTTNTTAPIGRPASPPPSPAPTISDTPQPAKPAAQPNAPQTASPAAAAGNTGNRQTTVVQTATNTSVTTTAPRVEATQTTQTTQNIQQPHQLRVQLADSRTLELTSPRPVAIGTQLRLTPQPDGSIQARALAPPPAVPMTEQQQRLVDEQLRQALPQQQPTGEVFSQLQQLASQNGAVNRSPVANAVRSMLSLFGVTPGDIDSPEAIQRNLELGGRLTESNLAQGKGLPAQDMKAALQQLQQLGERLPEDARRQLDQLIQKLQSRHTSQQLGALQQWRELPDGGQERVIQLDLPVRQEERYENVEVKITEEQRRSQDERFQTQWRVQLQFDLAKRGHLTAELVLQQDEQLSGSFWCERRETASEIRQRLPQFVSQLDNQGFEVNELHCHIGRPPGNKDSVRKQLIDLKT
ncbi:flagellar hook-length control protein FliK [Marinobacterium arenosum]|uniref:flagellar hook-length control protein FliK n=1 Tax=Marinobacterium arenosum TaxID=2862496 RepID=UPI001C93A094|nr:flagellar hook-length control protein FliK [Marinobacterium arenosum]MBY4675973.1 flagellar hook-length control protein FliK [Marinobacterium arenosum]